MLYAESQRVGCALSYALSLPASRLSSVDGNRVSSEQGLVGGLPTASHSCGSSVDSQWRFHRKGWQSATIQDQYLSLHLRLAKVPLPLHLQIPHTSNHLHA